MGLGISCDEDDRKELVKAIRKQMGLSQEKFTAEIGVTASTVNRWQNGKGKLYPLALKQSEVLRMRSK